jgi:tripartite-type tricarboxylate transporter receptor subunit TctC
LSRLSRLVAVVALALASMQPAHAQSYPDKPIRIVIPFPAGGGPDLVARLIAPKLTEALGQPIVFDYRVGANGTIGNEFVARSAPDGYTLLMGAAGALTVAPHVYAKVQFDTFKDFEPIALVGTSPYIVALHPSVPASSVAELTAYAKANPGKLNYGSSGTGGLPHLAGELYERLAGVDLVHVPYKGIAPAITDLVGGQVQLLFGDVGLVLPHVKAGNLKAIAVTSKQRATPLPDVPTMIEAGVPGYQMGTWWGLLAPAGTPRPIIARLSAEVRKALSLPEIQNAFKARSLEYELTTPEQFAARIRDEYDTWGRIVKEANIKSE